MKALQLLISKISSGYWFFLFFVLLNFSWQSAQAQSGTSMYDAFLIPGNGCGYTSYTDYQNNGYGFSNNYGQSSPDVWYRFTLSNAADVSISLCNSNFDTYLHLLDVNGNLVASDDDGGCGNRTSMLYQSLGTGTYYIVVEGYSSNTGDFNLDFAINGTGAPAVGADIYNPIYAGNFSGSGSYTDTRSNADACLGNDIGQPSNDIYYQFTLAGESVVTLSHCGSGFDTYMHLLDGSGNLITYNDDNSEPACPGTQSYIQMTLPAGTYYVVSEGYNTNVGNIVTNINVAPSSSGSAPVIAYTNPSSFTVGTAISPVSPSNTGGAVSSGGQSTTTLAGSGYAGSTNGTGTGASFNNPLNAAVDAAGNVYVADAGNHSIRKITPSGVVTTFAGSGYAGYADGVGTSASFQHPSFIAIDASGNLFVSDQQNHRIRKITQTGVVTTFAGSGSIGSANGTGTGASFYYPMGLTFDASGNLYVADSYNNKIRKISPSGVVSNFAGSGSLGAVNGAAGSASFKHPMGLGFDASGNLFVADRENYLVRKISTSGVVSTFAGSGFGGDANGIGTAATFNTTNNLVLDAEGNIYVSDHNNHRIRKITTAAEVSTLAGTTAAGSVNGTGSVVRFNSPFGIARGGDGAIYVIENAPNLIRKVVLLKAYTISPALPAGLVFNDTDGTISGTPTVVTPLTTYTITAYNSAGNHSTTLSFAVNAALACVEASQDQNYITTYIPREPGLTTATAVIAASCDPEKVQTGIQYFDGLGRPLQTVQVKGSPDKKDIVIPIAYDEFGREAKKYLPYMHDSNNGAYKANGLTKVIDYYTAMPAGQAVGFNTPFSESRFESSPLNRVLEQGAPGGPWQIGSGHTVKTEYGLNVYDDNVYSWSMAPNGSVIGEGNIYAAGEVFKRITRDENWVSGKAGTMEEFNDKFGRVILKRVWQTETNSLNTYYSYDYVGNLRCVLPPSVTHGGSYFKPFFYFVDSEPNVDFIYIYNYDHRNRLIEKKIPGKGWQYIVYNKLDQVVATQDAEQRKSGQWLVTKYDGLGRIVMTGLTTATRDAATIGATTQTKLWEEPISTGTGYSETCWPGALGTVLSINYYDNYNFPGNTYGGPSASQHLYVTGMSTGSKVNVLGSTTMLLTVNYYDDRGRIVQSKSDNYAGGSDIVTNTYHPIINELKTSQRQHTSATASASIVTRYTYDHNGRRKQVFENIDGQGEVELLSLNYNETGQLLSKGLHNNVQSTSYRYNERGWLKFSISPQFTFLLRYEDASLPQWNGNISHQLWGTSTPIGNTFSYSYDKLNRLLSGSAAGMSEAMTYDEMGNIKTLTRNGESGEYNYNGQGNRLHQIINGALATSAYGYDDNGNVTYDGRNQKTITYNILNLPQTVSGGISYTYDATGRKLRKQSGAVTTNYVDGIQYTGSSIDFIQTEEGRALNMAGTYKYEYNLNDHLGNVRYSFDIYNGSIRKIQEDNYFPFGKRASTHAGSPDNKYLYNGKELQEELGQYDYGARFYDPVIGRWNVVDPLAEVFENVTPYNYGMNNPALMIDPDGMAADTGKVINLPVLFISTPKIEPVNGFFGELNYFLTGGIEGRYKYDRSGNAIGFAPTMGMPPDLGFASTASKVNTVYKGIKGGLPYIGKSFNLLKRYTKAERLLLKIEPVLGNIKDTKLLRAIEQKVLEYKKSLGEVANKINAYSPNKKDYAEYMQKAEKWLSENASNWKDLF